MYLFILLQSFLVFANEPLVTSISVRGTSTQVKLATQVGQPLNATSIEKDVRLLWSIGRFEDIRVETREEAKGTAVVFQVVPARELRLHEIRIEPSRD